MTALEHLGSLALYSLLVAGIIAASVPEVLEAVLPWLGFIVPVLSALVLKAKADADVKLIVSLIVTILIAALSLATEPWGGLTAQMIQERIFTTAGQAQVAYVAVKLAVQTKGYSSINDLPALGPERGIQKIGPLGS